ncbi:MAG: ATP-binding protein [bacterium]|nr:ATP-binding protein [bacterium]
MKRLPIGISDFKELITNNYIYVDKTKYIYELLSSCKYVFLSRPRRFGKSLLLSTIEYLHEGQRELFNGLYIENKWNWSEKYPVIKINFAIDIKTSSEIYEVIRNEIRLNYKRMEIGKEREEKHVGLMLQNLIIEVSERYNKQVVVLIDEYDKPILDVIEDKNQAEEVRKTLKSFYSVLKVLDKYIRFVLVTGVSKFAKVSLFSGLNQLEDISLSKEYGDICGYTQQELEYYFKEYLKGINIEEVKEWYNGYNFLGSRVYNPFDVLLYLKKREVRNYWYETGRTEFLFKIIKQKNFDLPYLHKKYYTSEILEKFDIEYISIEALMFQTGYLTIKEEYKYENEEVLYSLDYPNKEVRKSFNSEILFYITGDYQIDRTTLINIAFKKENLQEIKKQIEVFISTISYEVLKNEYVYAAAIYGLVYATGYNVIIEDNTSKGRIDLTIVVDKKVVYIIEFKVLENEREKGKALKQIKEKEYHKKYLNCEKIYLVGIEFDKVKKELINFEYEIIGGVGK